MKDFFKKRENANRDFFVKNGHDIDGDYKFVHVIEEDEKEYAITAKIIIPKNSNMINKCIKYNKSPIRQILEKIEKEYITDLKEDKTETNLYNFEKT